jgi:hypothetical protein
LENRNIEQRRQENGKGGKNGILEKWERQQTGVRSRKKGKCRNNGICGLPSSVRPGGLRRTGAKAAEDKLKKRNYGRMKGE